MSLKHLRATVHPPLHRDPREVAAPSLHNNPQLDMTLTNDRPIFSAANPAGLRGEFTMTFEISADPEFPRGATTTYEGIKPLDRFNTCKQIEPGHELADGTYYWRARTVAEDGAESAWAMTRFHVDVAGSRTFAGFLRAPVAAISASGGEDPENVIEWNDLGLLSSWNSEPPAAGEEFSWVAFDMGAPVPVTRFWMLSTPSTVPASGWLKDFHFQSSADGKQWTDLPGTSVTGNNTYTNTIDFEPVNARYYRLCIRDQHGLQAILNMVIPYVRGEAPVPEVPDGDYVLLVGNQMNGFTYTQLAKFVENCGYPVVTVPHHQMSLAVLRSLRHPPMALICSGNNADYQYMPMFEYYGEFEVIRENAEIPMLGICAGNQFYAMAYGLTFAYWMGWFDDSIFHLDQGQTPDVVEIVPEHADDPVFRGLPNPFRAVEIHSWAIHPFFLQDPRHAEFELIAQSSYVQAIKSTRRLAYTCQFHPAVVDEYNQSGDYLRNFLALARAKRDG